MGFVQEMGDLPKGAADTLTPVCPSDVQQPTGAAAAPRQAALVTGSSRGIGLAIVEGLAADGFDVCLNCSSDAGLPETQQQAERISQQYGVSTCAVAADVRDAATAKGLVDAAIRELGGLRVLVCNAGITRDGLCARMSEADFDTVIDVNLKGVFNCCKAAVRPMMKQRGGRIIAMSSIVGVRGNAGQVNYAASKAGVIGLVKSLAKELAPRSITVNAVAPGYIATDMTAALSQAQRDAVAEHIGLGRLGDPEDVAHAVRFLASEGAGYITGQVIGVDGGLTL